MSDDQPYNITYCERKQEKEKKKYEKLIKKNERIQIMFIRHEEERRKIKTN